MKLITGLGNIGEKYLFTRHNAGFMAVDKIALDNNLEFKEERKLKSLITKFKHNSEDILLVKPTTFMNLSGEAVSAVMNYYKIDINNGSDGGHNGIKSIIKHLGTKDFNRLKIGIGPQPPIPSEAYVLQNFTKEQMPELKNILTKASEAALFELDNGIEKAQNNYNN